MAFVRSRIGEKLYVYISLIIVHITGMFGFTLNWDFIITLQESNSYCSNIWECPQCLSRQSKILTNIEQIQYLHVPKIKSIFIPSTLLELLIVRKCDELKHIIIDTGDHGSDGNSWGSVFPKLKNLTVDDCVQLEYIFEHYIDDHQNHTENHLQLPVLENFHLRNLPSLVALCPKQYHTTISPLKELVFNECSQVAVKNIGNFITNHSITRSVDGTIMKVSLFPYIFVVCESNQ